MSIRSELIKKILDIKSLKRWQFAYVCEQETILIAYIASATLIAKLIEHSATGNVAEAVKVAGVIVAIV